MYVYDYIYTHDYDDNTMIIDNDNHATRDKQTKNNNSNRSSNNSTDNNTH